MIDIEQTADRFSAGDLVRLQSWQVGVGAVVLGVIEHPRAGTCLRLATNLGERLWSARGFEKMVLGKTIEA